MVIIRIMDFFPSNLYIYLYICSPKKETEGGAYYEVWKKLWNHPLKLHYASTTQSEPWKTKSSTDKRHPQEVTRPKNTDIAPPALATGRGDGMASKSS